MPGGGAGLRIGIRGGAVKRRRAVALLDLQPVEELSPIRGEFRDDRHLIVRDAGAEAVFSLAARFVERISQAASSRSSEVPRSG